MLNFGRWRSILAAVFGIRVFWVNFHLWMNFHLWGFIFAVFFWFDLAAKMNPRGSITLPLFFFFCIIALLSVDFDL